MREGDSSTEGANEACILIQIRKSYKDCSNVCTTNVGNAVDDHHGDNAADDHHVGNAADDHHGGNAVDDHHGGSAADNHRDCVAGDAHHEGSADDSAACDDFLQATVDELRDHLLALVTSVDGFS